MDLTHSFDEETIYWPTETGFELEPRAEGMTETGYYYYANRFSAPEHGGTHVDAPRHFFQKGKTLDEIPPAQLMGIGVRIDVASKCSESPDYQITVDDLLAWEKANGEIPKEAIVLLDTGYWRRWPNRSEYLGTAERGVEAVKKLHFPGLSPEAARWLVTSRQIKAVGIDTPSIDYGQSERFESHVVLAASNLPNLENLANLGELPVRDFFVVALPMKIKGGSGGPTRIVAIVD